MRTRVTLVAVNLAAIAFSLLSWTKHGPSLPPERLDLDVYRIGGRVWLSGGHLYGHLPAAAPGIRLAFTYPPFAAIVLSPLSLIPAAPAAVIVTLGTIALLAVTLRNYLGALAWRLAWVLPLALVLEPVRSTISYGQVNVVLMTLVTADCLSRAPRWPRGALTGLAAAVKLTPLPFVVFFLLRRDYRAAGVMALTFAAGTGLGFALDPADSVRYWTSAVFDTSRIGDSLYAGNQSIAAVLARAGLRPGTPAATSLWLALSVAVLTVACLGMRRALAAADYRLALALNAFAALLVSPISWSHHWVWAGPALLAIAAADRRGHLPAARAAAVAGIVLFVVCPQWWFPHGGNRELHWAFWEQAAGSSYVAFAAAVLIMSLRIRVGERDPGARSSAPFGEKLDASGRHRQLRPVVGGAARMVPAGASGDSRVDELVWKGYELNKVWPRQRGSAGVAISGRLDRSRLP